jgi:phage N-6-adenine-methyltransferase
MTPHNRRATATSIHWMTPPSVMRALADVLGPVDLDVCAQPDTAQAQRYFTPEIDGLSQEWRADQVWCNPPYGRDHIMRWVIAAGWKITKPYCRRILMLIPAATDTSYWHGAGVFAAADYILFWRGRINFIDPHSPGKRSGNTSPSAILIFGELTEVEKIGLNKLGQLMRRA